MYSPLDYDTLTEHCREQICRCLLRASQEQGTYAMALRERAFGVYTGWRALVIESADPTAFSFDDLELSELVSVGVRRVNP